MLPREVDPLVHNMSHESPGDVKYSEIGGLTEQIRELREVSHDDVYYICVLCVYIRRYITIYYTILYCIIGDRIAIAKSRVIPEGWNNAT